MTSRITAIDLFCGAGGLTHGLARAGIDVRYGIDNDPACRFPYEANNVAEFIDRDVSTLSAEDVRNLWSPDSIRLLAGCAPCQPFSTYSRKSRRDKRDPKWALLLEFGRLVKETSPELVTMENVPQLVDDPVFSEFLSCLDGYSVSWSTVDCTTIGVPQTRTRFVLVASRLGVIRFSPKKAKVRTVRQTFNGLPSLSAGEQHEEDPLHKAPRLSELNLLRIRNSRPGGTWREWPTEMRAACHVRSSGDTFPSVYGRMEWDKPSPTMTTQCFGFGNGRFGHPSDDRAISLREAALLQTFPKNYRFVPRTVVPQFKTLGRLIGNAVPVRLGERIGECLVEHVADE